MLKSMRPAIGSDPHIVFGGLISILVVLQPFLGEIHHWMYMKRTKAFRAALEAAGEPHDTRIVPRVVRDAQGLQVKAPGRTWVGLFHMWAGRVIILGGIVNGGLGERSISSLLVVANCSS
jgi:hypothetical protein